MDRVDGREHTTGGWALRFGIGQLSLGALKRSDRGGVRGVSNSRVNGCATSGKGALRLGVRGWFMRGKPKRFERVAQGVTTAGERDARR